MAEAIRTRTPTLTPPASEPRPFLSILVPVRNEERFLGTTLARLFQQDYDPSRFEVLVADGASSDSTRDIVRDWQKRHDNLHLLDNPKRWSSAGRNAALGVAQGDLVVLIDGHCELDNPRYLTELADAFERSGADCLGRPQPLDVTGATLVQRAIARARSSRLGHHPASHIYSSREGFVPPQSVAVAYRRSVFEQVGQFDETFDACEDVEFNHRVARANLRCYFTPRVQVRYHPRSSLGGLFRQMVRYGRGRVRLLRKHPDTFSLPGFLPGAFVAGILAGPVLAWWLPVLGLMYGGVLAAYGLVVLLFSLAVSIRDRRAALLPLLPLVYFTIHVGAGVGLWWEALVGRARREGGFRTPVRQLSPLATQNRGERPLSPSPLAPVLRGEGLGVRGPEAVKFPSPPTPRPDTPGRGEEERMARSPLPLLNALTIDVEDYFQVSGFEHCVSRDQWDGFESRVEANTRRLLDVLEGADVQATFFVLGWVARRKPGLVRAIRAAGHEVGCHSYEHRLIYDQTPEEFRKDLRRGRDVLRDILGEPVTAYRAPSFSITARSLWALDVLVEEGFTVDSSIYPIRHDRYGLPGTPLEPHPIQGPAGTIWEFPPPVWRLLGQAVPVGGGGYFRLYPYGLTRRGLRAINRAGRPFAAYLHPWEIDPGQPRLAPGRLRAFRHYVNLHRTEQRLLRLLKDFPLGTLRESLAHWSGAAALPGRERAA